MTAGRNALSKGVQEPWERSHAPVTVNTLANKWIAQHSTARHNKSCEHKALYEVNVKRISKLLLYHNSACRQFGSCPQFLVTELRQHQHNSSFEMTVQVIFGDNRNIKIVFRQKLTD